jgi:hypothetical protein
MLEVDLMVVATFCGRPYLSLASATGAFLRRSVGALHGVHDFPLFHDDPANLVNRRAQILSLDP